MLLLSGTALGATAVTFRINVANTGSAITTLTGNFAGRLLQLTSSYTAGAAAALGASSRSATAATGIFENTGGGPALDLRVGAGKAPLRVNSTGKVFGLNVDLLDGLDQAAFARRTQEPWRAVGQSGQPHFEQCHDDVDAHLWYPYWVNYPGTTFNKVGFYKDTTGVVHLRGLARCIWVGEPPYSDDAGFTRGTLFTLPPGYRPSLREIRPTFIDSAVPNARIDILPTGDVVIASHLGNGQHGKDFVSLDGISFRAAP